MVWADGLRSIAATTVAIPDEDASIGSTPATQLNERRWPTDGACFAASLMISAINKMSTSAITMSAINRRRLRRGFEPSTFLLGTATASRTRRWSRFLSGRVLRHDEWRSIEQSHRSPYSVRETGAPRKRQLPSMWLSFLIGARSGRLFQEIPQAGVAQLEAQAICNRQVVGSSPTAGSIFEERVTRRTRRPKTPRSVATAG